MNLKILQLLVVAHCGFVHNGRMVYDMDSGRNRSLSDLQQSGTEHLLPGYHFVRLVSRAVQRIG